MSDDKRRLQEILSDYQMLPEYRCVKIEGVNTRSAFGDYPIHVAIVRGELNDVDLLLRNGADVNVHGDFGKTPLHMAVEFGDINIVKLLLKWGGDSLAKDLTGLTPPELAAILDKGDIVNLLNA